MTDIYSLFGDRRSLDEIWFDTLVSRRPEEYLSFTRFAVRTNPLPDTKEDMWEHDSNLIYLTDEQFIDVVSDSIDDAPGNSGAYAFLIIGLDKNYETIQEVVTLNGTTSVQTSKKFFRIHRALLGAAGSTGTNQGTITFKDNAADTLQCLVLPEISTSRSSHFTIPAGYTGYFIDGSASCFRSSGTSGNKSAEIETVLRFSDGRIIPGCAFGLTFRGTSLGRMTADYFQGWIPEKTDTKLTVTAEANNTKVTAFMTFLLVKGTDFYNKLLLI